MGKNETSWDRGFQTFNLGGPCCVNLLSELGPLVIGVHDESVSVRLSHVQINLAWWRVGFWVMSPSRQDMPSGLYHASLSRGVTNVIII